MHRVSTTKFKILTMLKRLQNLSRTRNNALCLGKIFFFLISCSCLQAQTVTEPDTLSKTLEAVEIVSATPVSGSGLNRNNLPMTIQSLTAKKIKEAQTMAFTQLINATLSSVHLNFAGGNILQPDLNYRGFTASPILGISQGVAVYQDGAKVNELFGNVVN